jgi:protein kinase C substrate 80K-H
MFAASKLDKEIDGIKNDINKVERDTGGDDDNKFGFEGELFILRNSCHSIQSGKYEYEVCIFGEAKQRDIGQKQGGTDLGSWKALQIDDDGVRTLKWTGGTKCWNGPQRSAEVIVTCGGLETKLLTADEPETCRYVFTMESPIGCDERFKSNNSL